MTWLALYLLFGPVPLLAALGLSLVGLRSERFGLIFLGGILAAPPALYLGGQPGYWPVVALPVLHFIAGVLAARGRSVTALLLLAPTAVAMVILAWIALR